MWMVLKIENLMFIIEDNEDMMRRGEYVKVWLPFAQANVCVGVRV